MYKFTTSYSPDNLTTLKNTEIYKYTAADGEEKVVAVFTTESSINYFDVLQKGSELYDVVVWKKRCHISLTIFHKKLILL